MGRSLATSNIKRRAAVVMIENAPAFDIRDAPPRGSAPSRVSVYALGMSLGLILAISFVLCVLFDLLFPGYAMNRVWAALLPGFSWLSWPGFFIGLVESFAYGWYVALVFGPLYNFFMARSVIHKLD